MIEAGPGDGWLICPVCSSRKFHPNGDCMVCALPSKPLVANLDTYRKGVVDAMNYHFRWRSRATPG